MDFVILTGLGFGFGQSKSNLENQLFIKKSETVFNLVYPRLISFTSYVDQSLDLGLVNVQMSARSDAGPGLPKLGESFYAKFIFLINARQIQSKFLKLVFYDDYFVRSEKVSFVLMKHEIFRKIRNFRNNLTFTFWI